MTLPKCGNSKYLFLLKLLSISEIQINFSFMSYVPDSEVAPSKITCKEQEDTHKRLCGNLLAVQSAVLSSSSWLLRGTHRVGPH
jgi:hypothetical protein